MTTSGPEAYRFPREPGTTPAGYPLPLTGSPITKTPVITEGESRREYPEHYIPGRESLAEDEMRITATGSFGPAPMRIAQGASGLLVELGNGDAFIFDVGGGTVGNLFSLGVHPADLDKLFITHLHLDHVGGIFALFDAMGWARNTPLHVWGPSGYTPELGTAAFTENVRRAAEWHVQSKQNVLPTGGTQIVAHEFDARQFEPEQPQQLVYDEDGVNIFAFPVIHTIFGAMGYRLEWNGLTLAYTADSEPGTFEAEQSRGADIFIHEVAPSAEEFSEKNHIPLLIAHNVMHQHTQPQDLGRVFDLARPRLGVGMHFPTGDDLIDPLFERWTSTYDGPLLLMQDLTTINVTADQITVRQAKTDLLAWAPLPSGKPPDSKPGPPSEAQRPAWLTETRLEPAEGTMTHSTKDMRSFFEDADGAGISRYIDKEVDVADEVPALCSQTFQPTMFRNLKGFEGFRLVDGLTRTRDTQKLALGFDGANGDVIGTYAHRLQTGPGPTVTVDDAPVKEVKWSGADANLYRLPIPTPSEGMDFPHLGVDKKEFETPCMSGAIVITSDPDTGLQNTFFSMAKVVGEQRLHFFLGSQHANANVQAWVDKGERAPIAFVIGCHPAYEFGAVYTGPHDGFSELNLISTLLGEAVPLVAAESIPLEVPAYAEIVVEGFVDPTRESYLHLSAHTDTHAPIFSPEPYVDVTAITMRNDPIYRHIQPTRFTEHHSLSEFAVAPMMYTLLEQKGVDVHDVVVPLYSGVNCAVIQMTPKSSEEVRAVLEFGMSFPMVPRLTIVVDQDVDPYNIEDVLYAVSIRADATRLTTLAEGSGLPESLNTQVIGRDEVRPLPNPRWGIDATKPALDEPERRLEFSRLRARGEGKVRLEDYLS